MKYGRKNIFKNFRHDNIDHSTHKVLYKGSDKYYCTNCDMMIQNPEFVVAEEYSHFE